MTTRSVRHSLSSGYSQASPLPALPPPPRPPGRTGPALPLLTARTHSAMLRWPQEAAAWRGVQPSLSCRSTSAPLSTRNLTMSKFSSMQACGEKRAVHAAGRPAAQRFQWHLDAQPGRRVQGTTSKLCALRGRLRRVHASTARPWGRWTHSRPQRTAGLVARATGRPAPPRTRAHHARARPVARRGQASPRRDLRPSRSQR